MRPNGVWAVLLAAMTLALIPLAADGAVAPPKCWMGKPGCTHTAIPHWNLTRLNGSVSVVGTRPPSLTCADVSGGAREEIVAGRYTATFTLDRKASQSRIAADANKRPITSTPLKLVFNVASTTHERVRRLEPAADGNCTESFRDCDKTDNSRASDSLDVFVRARRVIQEMSGDFVKSRLLECAETPTMASLLPDDPLEGKFMSEDSTFRVFASRDGHVTTSSNRQIGDGSTSIDTSAELSYARSIRACTRYPLTKARCRTARG
jgi:hypothetical protein